MAQRQGQPHGQPAGRPRRYGSNAARQRAYRQRLKLSVHFKSESVVWETPQAFFDTLDKQFSFTLDVCALPENAKCEKFYSPADDGLMQPWFGVCWCNPPYGKEIGLWVQKAYESALSGAATVVCLLPARTDTAWWHRYVQHHSEISFLLGRLKFGNSANSAPFPSALVIFRPGR